MKALVLHCLLAPGVKAEKFICHLIHWSFGIKLLLFVLSPKGSLLRPHFLTSHVLWWLARSDPFVLDTLGLIHPSVLEKWSWLNYPQFSLFSHSSNDYYFELDSWTSPLIFLTWCSSLPFVFLSLFLSSFPASSPFTHTVFVCFLIYLTNFHLFFAGQGVEGGAVPLNVLLPFFRSHFSGIQGGRKIACIFLIYHL